jgi:ammonia channel protein AmtB
MERQISFLAIIKFTPCFGVLILWVGWFGFNAGSTLSVENELFGHIELTTLFDTTAKRKKWNSMVRRKKIGICLYNEPNGIKL